MGTMEVVVMQPVLELLFALPGVLLRSGVGPFPQRGLNEPLCFSVGARRIGTGKAVFDVLSMQ